MLHNALAGRGTMSYEEIQSAWRSQAQGVATLFVSATHNRVQIDVETSAAATSGTLAVSFLTPLMTQPKPLRDESGNKVSIDLADPYPVQIRDMMISQLLFTPAGFDADKTYHVAVVSAEVQ